MSSEKGAQDMRLKAHFIEGSSRVFERPCLRGFDRSFMRD
jgi:hypothetical protein